jgi:hypothetical protein
MEEWWEALGEQERQSLRQHQQQLLQEQLNELRQQHTASSSGAGDCYGEYQYGASTAQGEGEASSLAVAPPEPGLASSGHDLVQHAPNGASRRDASRKQIDDLVGNVGRMAAGLVGNVGRIAAGLRAHPRLAKDRAHRTGLKEGEGEGVRARAREAEGGAGAGAGAGAASPYEEYEKAAQAQNGYVRATPPACCLVMALQQPARTPVLAPLSRAQPFLACW